MTATHAATALDLWAVARNPRSILTLALLASALAVGSPAARGGEPLPAEFMPVSQLRPGMIGEGRSVFAGYKVEPFKVEILGVEHQRFAGGDVIYAKLSGGPLEQHGVVSGMSGSPVYVGGKLIGAVAYGWSFAYKPYCGITPIEQMWRSVFQNIGRLKAPPERRSPGRGGVGAVAALAEGQPWDWQADFDRYRAALAGGGTGPESVAGLAGLGGLGGPAGGQANDASGDAWRPDASGLADAPGQMQPLAAPLFLSGASPEAARILRNFFASRGMGVVGVGTLGGAADDQAAMDDAPELEPGSTLGVPLLSGDLSLASIGTVTWRQGDKIIAFGHPMFFKGPINAPMAAARVFGVMQSYMLSFKLGEVGRPIGTIDQDRVYGVGGRLGKAPDRVPVTVTIGGGGAAISRRYRFSCWKDADAMPALILAATQEAFDDSVARQSKLTADVTYAIALADGRRIEKTLRSSSDFSAIEMPLGRMLRDLILLTDNPFAEADLASVDVSVRVEPGFRDDELMGVEVDHDAFEPGQTARLTATIRPWRGDDYHREIRVTLPKDLTPGSYAIQVTDAGGADRLDRLTRPGFYEPRDFDQVLAMTGRPSPRSDQLTVSLVQPVTDLDLKGRLMTKLPGSVGELMRSSAADRDQATAVGRVLSQQAAPTEGPVSGSRSARIEVRRRVDQSGQ